MGRNVEIHDTPPTVAYDEEAIEDTEGYGRNGKEVHRCDSFPVISKKGKPAFCWLRVSRRSFHPAGNRSFRDIETEHVRKKRKTAPTRSQIALIMSPCYRILLVDGNPVSG